MLLRRQQSLALQFEVANFELAPRRARDRRRVGEEASLFLHQPGKRRVGVGGPSQAVALLFFARADPDLAERGDDQGRGGCLVERREDVQQEFGKLKAGFRRDGSSLGLRLDLLDDRSVHISKPNEVCRVGSDEAFGFPKNSNIERLGQM